MGVFFGHSRFLNGCFFFFFFLGFSHHSCLFFFFHNLIWDNRIFLQSSLTTVKDFYVILSDRWNLRISLLVFLSLFVYRYLIFLGKLQHK